MIMVMVIINQSRFPRPAGWQITFPSLPFPPPQSRTTLLVRRATHVPNQIQNPIVCLLKKRLLKKTCGEKNQSSPRQRSIFVAVILNAEPVCDSPLLYECKTADLRKKRLGKMFSTFPDACDGGGGGGVVGGRG